MISYPNPGSNAFSRLKMPKYNLIADNFLIQFFAHVTLKYSAYAKESTLTVYKGNVCKKWRNKIEVRSGERLHLQWHKDTFSQAHASADSKVKVKSEICKEKYIKIVYCSVINIYTGCFENVTYVTPLMHEND